MHRQLKKAGFVLLLSSLVLLLTLMGTTGASAKTIQRHTFIPLPIFVSFPFPSTFLPSQYLIFPLITPIGDTDQTLDSNSCFSVAVQGHFFSRSYNDDQYADFYARDSSGDSLYISPRYTRVNSVGKFTRWVQVCGVSSSETMVTIVAVDDATGIASNPFIVNID